MVIVEQSLNIASAISDRVVFIEKGRVRFDGSAQDLAARTTSPARCSSEVRAANPCRRRAVP